MTESDIRRIVREEIERANKINSAKFCEEMRRLNQVSSLGR